MGKGSLSGNISEDFQGKPEENGSQWQNFLGRVLHIHSSKVDFSEFT